MDSASQVYGELNLAWKETCRVLFGEEIGELREYAEWLNGFLPAIGRRKSHISGREVILTASDYSDSAKFVSLDEAKEKKVEQLTINEIKDVDSIIRAISEKWEYAGNKVLGNSAFVEASDTVKDSQYVMDSASVEKSSYVYASFQCSNSRHVFGSMRIPDAEFIVAGMRGFGKRCFDYYWCIDNSDLYVCANCNACSHIMFSFNQKNRNYCIGNLRLPKEKYFSLRDKLVGEIRDELRKDKAFPSIFELVPDEAPGEEAFEIMRRARRRETGDLRPIDAAFRSTFRVVFRKEIEGIVPYEKWLYRNVPQVREVKTVTGSKTYTLRPEFYRMYSKLPKRRVLTFEESSLLADLHLDEGGVASFRSIRERLAEIAYISDEFYGGEYENLIQCGGGERMFHIYKCDGAKLTEYAALGSFPHGSKYVFGCDRAINSQFCIKCSHVLESTRCFEADSCEKCSDSYFAHNCEGLADCMFCFNTKAKRHAIGNLPLPVAQYRKTRDTLVGQMADEILATKGLKHDIFSIGG